MNISHHAIRRCDQRAIQVSVLDMIIDYGIETHDKNGDVYFSLNGKPLKILRQQLRHLIRTLEGNKGLFAVVSQDGNIITTGHEYTRHKTPTRSMRKNIPEGGVL
jgi:hypothetical protein